MMRIKLSSEQIAFLTENYKNPEKTLLDMFNKKFNANMTPSSLSNYKHKLGLQSGLKGGQFQKGQHSFNKGKKWDEFMSKEGQANSLRTCFKEGHIPQNHRPVGSERVNVYGYIEVKVEEPRKWKLKHRVIWESVNGAIPKGFNCVFLDGNKLNCSIENLTLISKSTNATMNKLGLFKSDKDLTNSGIAYANLLNAISKKEKHRG